MDLQMPRMGGVAATRQLAQELPQVRVVVLTTFDDDELVFEAVRASAQAYLLKDAEEAEVLETVRAVHRGESRLSPSIARRCWTSCARWPRAVRPRPPSRRPRRRSRTRSHTRTR